MNEEIKGLLSFIIPVYKPNNDLFGKVIKALTAQSLNEWEAIFVLDGPCPEAMEAIKNFSRKVPGKITVFEIEHGGAPKARNYGAKYAKGEYLCFWDSDCLIEPGASQNWVNIFEKRQEVGFIYSGYKFFGEKLAIESEEFDPYTLRVRNYITTCSPLRKVLYPGWCEDLKSLQDWDFWLSVMEKAQSLGWDQNRIGLFLRGYSFSTSFPTTDSISGQGCTPEKWLERLEAVKSRHNIPVADTCVSSLQYKQDGLVLAKILGVEYQDFPNDKPNRYKTFIQIGFSLRPELVEKHASVFSKPETKAYLFWTGDNINEIYHGISFNGIYSYSQILNVRAKQYVEDIEAKKLMENAGFKVEILPFPMVSNEEPSPLPTRPCFAVDIAEVYGQLFGSIERSVPDIDLDVVTGMCSLKDYTGIIHFFPDKTMSGTVKRALLSGRHVISNIQQPYCGYVSDVDSHEKFIVDVVNKLRTFSDKPINDKARSYYQIALGPDKFKEILCSAQ